MTWKQLIESFLIQPSKLVDHPRRTLACLSITFSPISLEGGLLSVLGLHSIVKAKLISGLPEPDLSSGHDMGVQLFYKDCTQALQSALLVDSILANYKMHASVSLGYGAGIELEGLWKSTEAFRAERLNYYSSVHEIAATQSFMSAITVPPGIGSYQAPIKLQKAAGFAFWILKDYR